MTKIIALLLILIIGASCGTAKKVNEQTVKEMLSCPISIIEAQKNLESAGYIMVSLKPTEVVTDYKFSEKEQERFWLGSSRRDYYRRMIVSMATTNSVTFDFDYKVLVHAHPTENAEERTENEKINPKDLSEERLKVIRDDVCKAAVVKMTEEQADQEMVKKCNDGNGPACIYLFNTLEVDKPKEAYDYLRKACQKKKVAECSKLE